MKKLLIVTFYFILSFQLFAQVKLPAKCEVWLPKKIDKGVISKADAYSVVNKPYGQNSTPREKNYWVVFSDRENNTTYESPKEGAKVYSSLDFNERLIIAKIQKGYALVYSEPKSVSYPRISADAKSRGWVPISNLLLWTKGLADDSGISYKAILCANLNVSGNESEGMLFKSPTGRPIAQLKTDMHFYFVMKEEGSKVLLGNYFSMPTDSNSGLLGWVDVNTFVPWNQRTCLEPTWDHHSVEKFSRDGKQWKIYADKDQMYGVAPAQGVFSTAEVRKASDRYKDEYKYRTMSARRLRYPILEGSTDQLYHCSAFGTLGGEIEKQIDEDLQTVVDNLEKTQVINIGIVIDGTSSMKPYFSSVKDAIKEGCSRFGQSHQINVAVAIYRDKEDGDYVLETFPSAGDFTNPTNQNLMRFLDTGGKYGVKSVAPGDAESLYYGIKTAIEKFNYDPKNSNLLLVVGDCGDNGKMGVDRQEIIDLLSAKNISLMSFQVRNMSKEAYQSFNTQMTYLMTKSLQKRYDAMAKNVGMVNQTSVKAKTMPGNMGWEIFDNNVNENTELYRYIHRRNPAMNVSMEASELASMMDETIGKWKKQIDYITKIANTIADGGDLDFLDEGGFTQNLDGDGTLTMAVQDLMGVDKKRFERIRKMNSLSSFQGWSVKSDAQSELEYYKVVVFFPDSELEQLMNKLEPVYRVALARSNDRIPYYNAMVQLARNLLAQDDVQDHKYKEIIAKVLGLDDKTAKIEGPSLADICDPNVVSHREYLQYLNKMKTRYEFLNQLMSETYPFVHKTAGSGDRYYWLPIEYLPL